AKSVGFSGGNGAVSLGVVIAALVLALVVSSLVPASTRGLDSRPNPVMDYEQAAGEIERLIAEDERLIRPECRSTLLTHGEKTQQAVVCFHGLTDSPAQFSALGARLFDAGANVLAPRLPFHGVEGDGIAALRGLDATAYRDYADKTVDLARGLGENIDVIGLSAGGVVAAWIGQNRNDVRRSIAVAPALGIAAGPSFASTLVENLFTKVRKLKLGRGTSIDVVYSGIPMSALAETLRLGTAVIAAARTTPPEAEELVMVLNANDEMVDGSRAAELARRWQGHGREVVTYEFGAGLRVPHDAVDPADPEAKTSITYPVLLDLLAGRAPSR
ncbi:MAG: alpha/beta hydrolase, partial [Gaiellales bacterium]